MSLNLSNILKHPLSLIIIGFFFTQYLGGDLVENMNIKEFETQQKILFQEKLLEKQIVLSESLIVSLNEYLSACNKIEASFLNDTTGVNMNSMMESVRNSSWNSKKEVFRHQSLIFFKDEQIDALFTDIDKAQYRGSSSSNYQFIKLIRIIDKTDWVPKKQLEPIQLQLAKNRIFIQDKLKNILSAMRKEIQRTENSGED